MTSYIPLITSAASSDSTQPRKGVDGTATAEAGGARFTALPAMPGGRPDGNKDNKGNNNNNNNNNNNGKHKSNGGDGLDPTAERLLVSAGSIGKQLRRTRGWQCGRG